MGPSISLELTVDDLVAYNLHVLRSASPTRKYLRRVQLRMMVLLAAMSLLLWVAVLHEDPTFLPFFVLAVCVFAVLMLFRPAITARRMPGQVRRYIANGLIPAPTPSRLWVDDRGGIVEESSDRTTWYSPAAIAAIEETPTHIFITVAPARALVIPRRIGEPAVEAFLQTLHWYRRQIYAGGAGHPSYGPNAWSV